jgi:hypothetical protein
MAKNFSGMTMKQRMDWVRSFKRKGKARVKMRKNPKEKYTAKQIAKELEKTASGQAYYGNALYVSLDFPFLTLEEKHVLKRYLKGMQKGTDHITLQDIANKIRISELKKKNPRNRRQKFSTLKAWKAAAKKYGFEIKQGSRKNYIFASVGTENVGNYDKKNKKGYLNPSRSSMLKNSRSRFTHEHIRSPSKFAKGSIRTKRLRGGKEVRIGCPKGRYNKKTRRCKVGTRAVSILKPNPRERTFHVFAKKGSKYFYWNGKDFNTNYTLSHRFRKESAIRAARVFARKYPHIVFGVSDGKA